MVLKLDLNSLNVKIGPSVHLCLLLKKVLKMFPIILMLCYAMKKIMNKLVYWLTMARLANSCQK